MVFFCCLNSHITNWSHVVFKGVLEERRDGSEDVECSSHRSQQSFPICPRYCNVFFFIFVT